MIGIIPSSSKTFEVGGTFETSNPEEGKLYIDPMDKRLYYFSPTLQRSNPSSGFFPVWNGKDTYISKFSNEKYERDIIKTDISSLSSSIGSSVAENVRYLQRRSSNEELLQPAMKGNDNMFTQIIKGVITYKKLTLIDLIDISGLSEKVIRNYYGALTKIAFMRMDRWEIWVNQIFHLSYVLTVYSGEHKLVSYSYPADSYDSGVVCYSNITKTNDDYLKKIVKILMIMENINKNDLRSDEVDDYTINNMLTTLWTSKPLSAQLFSRFIRMAKLSYTVEVSENDKQIFEYRE